ncbi:hypothetical protein LWI29_037678 [Acer saccharum]|uniref:Uncharacterized protein n=1 Tax=Acer saccharum TaxID=4024 RepID=A0AA39W7V8_ACESA|nr:hypothetical protein LWI29_037678 [Acer saccharum]
MNSLRSMSLSWSEGGEFCILRKPKVKIVQSTKGVVSPTQAQETGMQRCDKLGHVMDECTMEMEVEVEVEEEREVSSATSRKLVVWLRASGPPKRSFKGSGRQELAKWGQFKGREGYNRRCMITDGG